VPKPAGPAKLAVSLKVVELQADISPADQLRAVCLLSRYASFPLSGIPVPEDSLSGT